MAAAFEEHTHGQSSIEAEAPPELLELPHHYLLSKARQARLRSLGDLSSLPAQGLGLSDRGRPVVASVIGNFTADNERS